MVGRWGCGVLDRLNRLDSCGGVLLRRRKVVRWVYGLLLVRLDRLNIDSFGD